MVRPFVAGVALVATLCGMAMAVEHNTQGIAKVSFEEALREEFREMARLEDQRMAENLRRVEEQFLEILGRRTGLNLDPPTQLPPAATTITAAISAQPTQPCVQAPVVHSVVCSSASSSQCATPRSALITTWASATYKLLSNILSAQFQPAAWAVDMHVVSSRQSEVDEHKAEIKKLLYGGQL